MMSLPSPPTKFTSPSQGQPVAPAQPSAIQTSMLPSNQSSLGSTLIANGIVRRSNAMGTDPLAPIRRMSQAEKIAFFS